MFLIVLFWNDFMEKIYSKNVFIADHSQIGISEIISIFF